MVGIGIFASTCGKVVYIWGGLYRVRVKYEAVPVWCAMEDRLYSIDGRSLRHLLVLVP